MKKNTMLKSYRLQITSVMGKLWLVVLISNFSFLFSQITVSSGAIIYNSDAITQNGGEYTQAAQNSISGRIYVLDDVHVIDNSDETSSTNIVHVKKGSLKEGNKNNLLKYAISKKITKEKLIEKKLNHQEPTEIKLVASNSNQSFFQIESSKQVCCVIGSSSHQKLIHTTTFYDFAVTLNNYNNEFSFLSTKKEKNSFSLSNSIRPPPSKLS